MTAKTQIEPMGRPGRRPSLNADHTAVLRAITQEQPRSSLDEVTRELLRRTGVKVNPVTVRKALREAGIQRLKPLRRSGERAAVQGAAPARLWVHLGASSQGWRERHEHRPDRGGVGAGGRLVPARRQAWRAAAL